MKAYVIDDGGKPIRILADEHGEYLVWPRTTIPFINKRRIDNHPQKKAIEVLIEEGNSGDENALKALWDNPDILNLTFKVSDVS